MQKENRSKLFDENIDQLTDFMFKADDGKTVLAVSTPSTAKDALQLLCFHLGVDVGDKNTTVEQFTDKFNLGFNYFFNATIDCCADVVEEATKNPQDVTWGVLKQRILDLKIENL